MGDIRRKMASEFRRDGIHPTGFASFRCGKDTAKVRNTLNTGSVGWMRRIKSRWTAMCLSGNSLEGSVLPCFQSGEVAAPALCCLFCSRTDRTVQVADFG